MAKAESSDYIQPVYLDRAMKHLIQNAGGADAVRKLSKEQLEMMAAAQEAIALDMQFNTLKWFRPFPYQLEFYKTGKNFVRRGLIAANRSGKTIATTYELAMHLTGQYPDWWEGKVWETPVVALCSGEAWEQVAKTLQNKLLGCDDVKQAYKLGSGAIPRDAIDQKSMRTDGANILAVEIHHKSGGKSKLYFSNYTQQVKNLQGFELDIVCFDEQPPDEIFSELVVRTAARKGQILCSFTPLKGMSGLVRKFWDQVDGYCKIQVGWKDVPFVNEWGEDFFTQEERDQMYIDFMPWERDCRINGTPMAGKGVVFPVLEWPTYSSKDIDFSKFPHFEKLISLDLGQKIDPTVISFFYRDPVESIIYLHRQIKMPSQSTPDEWIRYLADENSRGVPIALPHDANQAGRYTLTSLSVRETFEDVYGLNVIQENIMNPEDVAGKKSNVKAYGVNRLQQGIVNGWFRIHESCKGFLDEARDYHIKDDGKFSDPDDHIDSARYGLLALEQGHGETILNRSASFAHKRLAPIEGKIQRI